METWDCLLEEEWYGGRENKRGSLYGAELARVRVEGGEAGEVTVRHIERDIAGHKKDLITSE